MRTLTLSAFVLVTACSSDLESGHKLGEFEAFTEAVENLTENHVAAVDASASLDAVGDLETEYAANWAFFGDELGTIQGELELCDLADGMQAHLDATQAAIDVMATEMSNHAAVQAGQTDLGASIAEEESHGAIMMGAIEDCLAAHEAMHDGVTCDGEHMAGM